MSNRRPFIKTRFQIEYPNHKGTSRSAL